MPPPLERVWTPQLRPYPEDAAIFQDPDFAKVFEEHAATTRTRRNGQELRQKLADVLSEPRWVQFQSDWLDFTLGGEIVGLIPGDVVERCQQLFIDFIELLYKDFEKIERQTKLLGPSMNAENIVHRWLRWAIWPRRVRAQNLWPESVRCGIVTHEQAISQESVQLADWGSWWSVTKQTMDSSVGQAKETFTWGESHGRRFLDVDARKELTPRIAVWCYS
ncbi:hypothetical protein DFH07DRAFT_778556 [Mycena maculata]|uniref:Uncharacterized protein n=1 Tax=Mycena maculata TaxID=230809 RepID=A0AAD7ICG8_9AGAR|nr:hypothetical protein DFH07DRAFT_778556 [Mycena maculata]